MHPWLYTLLSDVKCHIRHYVQSLTYPALCCNCPLMLATSSASECARLVEIRDCRQKVSPLSTEPRYSIEWQCSWPLCGQYCWRPGSQGIFLMKASAVLPALRSLSGESWWRINGAVALMMLCEKTHATSHSRCQRHYWPFCLCCMLRPPSPVKLGITSFSFIIY